MEPVVGEGGAKEQVGLLDIGPSMPSGPAGYRVHVLASDVDGSGVPAQSSGKGQIRQAIAYAIAESVHGKALGSLGDILRQGSFNLDL